MLVWQLDNLDADPVVLIGHERFVEAVAFSPDSQTLASGGAEGLVRLWNLADLAATPVSLDDPRSTVRSVRAVAFGPDGPNGPKLAAADATGGVDVWDAGAAQFAYSLPPSQPPGAFAVAFGSDGVLAVAMSDASILLWDARTNLELGRLPLLAQPVSTLSFAEDGTLASGGAIGSNDDPPVLLWSLSVDAMQQVACRVANRGLTGEEKQQFMPDPSAYVPVCETVLASDTAPAAAPAGTPVATPS